MAKRFKTKKIAIEVSEPLAPHTGEPHPKSIFWALISSSLVPLLLAVVTFLVYAPSLKSGFVYDMPLLIQEGFFTSLSNLPAVLSLKVLSMNLLLADRPGELLYLMSIAAVCGTDPLAYHLWSNLLHAVNVALLYVVLLGLAKIEMPALTRNGLRRVQLAIAAVSLIFALHPIAVEPVASISYCSDLLVTCFTLLALFAATYFQPRNFRLSMIAGFIGAFCALAAVACKESGVIAPALLIVYWFLYRRDEARVPWFLFLSAAMAVTVAFLIARFVFAFSDQNHPDFFGGSLAQVFLLQPRLWVFMMGKLVWPVDLSADYALIDLTGPSTLGSLVILAMVVSLQGWLAWKSRIGALGVAFYWLGLATVSNFIPLYRVLGDRFYYLPMVGVAMQLLAVILMMIRFRDGFWGAVAPCFLALVPLTLLTLTREDVFASEISLWTDTVQANPFSTIGHAKLGGVLLDNGRLDEAIFHLQKAIEISPRVAEAHNNLGSAFFQTGQVDAAIAEFRTTAEIKPNYSLAYYNLGVALSAERRDDEAMVQLQKAVDLDPHLAAARTALANLFLRKGRLTEAIAQFQEVVRLNPDDVNFQNNLAQAQARLRQGSDPKR